MYLSGVSFYVLADHFLVHQSHVYDEAARKNEVHRTILYLNFERAHIVLAAQVESQNICGLQGRDLSSVRLYLALALPMPAGIDAGSWVGTSRVIMKMGC